MELEARDPWHETVVRFASLRLRKLHGSMVIKLGLFVGESLTQTGRVDWWLD